MKYMYYNTLKIKLVGKLLINPFISMLFQMKFSNFIF